MRLSSSEALLRYFTAQKVEFEGQQVPFLAGVWAIFGHGNLGGMGAALGRSTKLPTYRGHNEQGMTHAALSYAKACRRERIMAVTTSIGPGSTNLVTGAATAHVNRLPMLLLPGDIFADRKPDPVLQQLEHPLGPDVVVTDCLRPISRYFDRIYRPEQLVRSLPEALRVLLDPVECGPVTLALPQDVQVEVADFPEAFFEERIHRIRRPPPESSEITKIAERLSSVERVLIVVGGGVRYSRAESALRVLAETQGWPVAETQAGKGSLPADHPLNLGGLGVTGTTAANQIFQEVEHVVLVGTRLSDFTTGSGELLRRARIQLTSINVHPSDAAKYGAYAVVGDAKMTLEALQTALADKPVVQQGVWAAHVQNLRRSWVEDVDRALHTSLDKEHLPSDAEVIYRLRSLATDEVSVVAAAGGVPGDLHRIWSPSHPDAYLVEYGYSCMGHELAGALGAKLARPEREVWAILGDGSYLMLSAEIATSVALSQPFVAWVLDNSGFGCIYRLDQRLHRDDSSSALAPGHLRSTGEQQALSEVSIEGHARSLGAYAETLRADELANGLERARASRRTAVLVVKTDAHRSFELGGFAWRVPNDNKSR